MVVVIDHYDSFVYNIVRLVRELGYDVKVVRHDAVHVSQLLRLHPEAFILSPGPCRPGLLALELIKALDGRIPLLGVCLGHQTLAQAFGGRITRTHPMHGKVSSIYHEQRGLFRGLPSPFQATRYHSLAVDHGSLPLCLRVTAMSKEGVIMALEHTEYSFFGVQFHPESLLSEHGPRLLKNFLEAI